MAKGIVDTVKDTYKNVSEQVGNALGKNDSKFKKMKEDTSEELSGTEAKSRSELNVKKGLSTETAAKLDDESFMRASRLNLLKK